jgi:hypothetical protein
MPIVAAWRNATTIDGDILGHFDKDVLNRACGFGPRPLVLRRCNLMGYERASSVGIWPGFCISRSARKRIDTDGLLPTDDSRLQFEISGESDENDTLLWTYVAHGYKCD